MKITLPFCAAICIGFTGVESTPNMVSLVRRADTGQVSDFCQKSGITPSNGTQNQAGSCSSTVQGSIPSVDKMPSTLIISPENGATVSGANGIDVTVRTINVELGHNTEPATEYYIEPQSLNAKGFVQGHQHVVFQKMNANDQQPLDPQQSQVAFFKGLDQKPGGGTDLFVTTPPLQAGMYRVCTMTGSRSHQTILVPVAVRGAQDDCIRITVN